MLHKYCHLYISIANFEKLSYEKVSATFICIGSKLICLLENCVRYKTVNACNKACDNKALDRMI